MIEVEFYSTENNKCPVLEFLETLDDKMKAKIFRAIDLLEKNGHELREPSSKSLGDGIFELRVKQSSNISRILYFFYVGNKAVLTNGFIKKTQKTPLSEIKLAKKYKVDYERRMTND